MPTSLEDDPERRFRLEPADLRWRCDPAQFPFETTDRIGECPIRIIGQDRALGALRLGLSVRADGYNIFVAGEVGTGRSTSVRRELGSLEPGESAPDDLVYVHNFRSPDEPRLLRFPAGRGRAFAQAMDDLVEGLRKTLPELFESDFYRKEREKRVSHAQDLQKEKLREFERRVEKEGFALVQVQVGPLVRPELAPVVAGNPVPMDQLETLVEQGRFEAKQFDRLNKKFLALREAMEDIRKEVRKLDRSLRQELVGLDQQLARPLVEEAVADVREAFPGPGVESYLDEVVEHLLDHLDSFRETEEPPSSGVERERARAELRERMRPYKVNVVVEHGETRGRPVLWETSPSYRNLFGTIEAARESSGEWTADHTRIRAGSLARASGGFLVLDAMDVLVEPGVWPALKRTLRTRVLEIRAHEPLSFFPGIALKPEPIPLDVKVILIGTPQIYRLLYALDEDFKKIFKIKADFALDTPRSDIELGNYACFVHKKCNDDGLPPFHRSAVAAVVEHGVRLAGSKDKMTTRFNEVADLVREAAYWARQEGSDAVQERHVDRAVSERVHRLDLIEQVLRERIAEGTILLELEGRKVGQVNGLMVLDLGDYAFGIPARITAVVAMGRAGILHIEREAALSGAIHTKGVLTLGGFLRSRFAQDKPLTLTATLTFEQNYAAVEGDSASAAELFALLSALGGVPLRQGIAVTGSVNQAGELQPVGGINEKIEGYFDLCRLVGLGHEQGVLIPARNVRHLMLRKDVVEAVAAGRFHVFAVSTVEEGLEILAGLPAGRRQEDGRYPEGSFFARVDERLRDLAFGVRPFGPADSGAPA